MAKLTEDQQQSVARWAAEGATLNDIQGRLKSEFDLTLTYMDTRLLIMELGVKLVDKPKEKLPEPEPEPAPAAQDASSNDFNDEAAPETGGSPPPDGGKVTLTIDEITIPGTMVSGKATFSDGKTAGWYLDQMGRLGLRAPEPGYQPPAADIPVFQSELQRLLQTQGY